tara:strand:- start:930 stop:1394 length:465 start_codon:yes stop_codon:yes gene_type:complete
MDWVQALTNAGTGGILGIVGSVASGWMKLKGMKVKAEIDREMLKLQIDKGTIEADSADFQASQKSAQVEGDALISVAQIAEKPWQKGLLIWHFVFKGSVRPMLALGAHVLAGILYFQMPEEYQNIILNQIFTIAFAYGGWYFGQRDLNKRLFSE